MEAVRQRIAARTLSRGDKLPSIRATAAAQGVSVSTVVEAYDRLAAEGVLRSRPGSGFYVAGQATPLSLAEVEPKAVREVDPFWVSRQSLNAEADTLRPGCGWLPDAWMPQAELRAALRALSRGADAPLVEYARPSGHPLLRQLLSRRMAEHGIDAPPNQIVLAESGTQAIDLLCRTLLEPGDSVLVDDPCYFNFHALLRAHRARIVGVPRTPNGPDLVSLARILAEHRPRLYITNSGLHNPTGAALSPVTAHHVLKLAEQNDLTIIEDDIFADFEQARAPRLAAFDGLNRVIHIGSFSKTLSASIRCGYIAARADWIEGLVDLQIATSFGGSRFNAELLFHVLRTGGYRRHMERLRQRLSVARVEVAKRLKPLGITPWITPEAGMFLWCKLPDGVDAAALARSAVAERIVLAPGDVFSTSQSAKGYMRFNVAQSLDPRLYDFLRARLKRLT